MQIVRCDRLADDDRRIGSVCKPCGPEGVVAMRLAQQRNHPLGEDGPVAAAAFEESGVALRDIAIRSQSLTVFLVQDEAADGVKTAGVPIPQMPAAALEAVAASLATRVAKQRLLTLKAW
jgi:hypothetical protein